MDCGPSEQFLRCQMSRMAERIESRYSSVSLSSLVLDSFGSGGGGPGGSGGMWTG